MRRQPPALTPGCERGLRVTAHIDGTLNDGSDHDRGWTAEMAIPLKELATAGVPLDHDHPWTVLAGRYNYDHRQTRSTWGEKRYMVDSDDL